MATNNLQKVLAWLTKDFGAGIVNIYADIKPVDVQRVSTGLPSLDYILGGGVPLGRVIEIFGPNASGKTTLAIQMMIKFQEAFPEKRVAFIDTEHALDPKYATSLGLNMSEIVFSQPDTAEQALSIYDALAGSGDISLIVLDSVAKLSPKKEVEGNIGDAEMGMRARLMGQWLRKIVPNASRTGCTCVFLNQVRATIWNMYWPSETRPSATALEYDASIILRASSKTIDEFNAVTKFQVKKNKVGMPFRETSVDIAFWKWYNVNKDLITLAKEIGAIGQKGAYYTFDEFRWQGGDAMFKEIESNPDLFKKVEKATHQKLAERDTNTIVLPVEEVKTEEPTE